MAKESALAEDIANTFLWKVSDSEFKEILNSEKEKRITAEMAAEAARLELEKVNTERKNEILAIVRERMEMESEKNILSTMGRQLADQLQKLSEEALEIQLEKLRVEKLRLKAEKEKESLLQIRLEVDMKKRAIRLARLWAEDEARRAQAQGIILMNARKHWKINASCDCFDLNNQLSEIHSKEASIQDSRYEDAQVAVPIKHAGRFLQHKLSELLQETGKRVKGLQQFYLQSTHDFKKQVPSTVAVIPPRSF
eukprot:c12848_g1_i1 orf=491-1249(-)